jgi:alpha-mannosidase
LADAIFIEIFIILFKGAAESYRTFNLSVSEETMKSFLFVPGFIFFFCASPVSSETPLYDYSKDKVLHVVGTAHLDTQWRWTIQKTIDEYIPKTLRDNFARFEKYPDYVFSFEGAFRYMLANEYYPEEYARLKKYIASNRWAVCGSSVDAGDSNIPSPESLIRHILYGNGYFRKEFGHTSRDIFLPDCFGFGFVLPTVAAHCGLKGFSTQKLSWGSSVGVPFDLGVWEGVDGASVVAEMKPGPYVSNIGNDLSSDANWLKTIDEQGKQSGVFAGYRYFGVGDMGGAPNDTSVAWLEKGIHGKGPIHVISAPADLLSREITPQQKDRLPRYRGELLMTTHGTGCYTSQSAMKLFNRKNELLADAAERASVTADWLGGSPYPGDALKSTWIQFLWHQFHDDLTGTSIPEAYTFSWNDELLALNRFSSVLNDAVGASSRALDTRVKGQPVVVYNPLAIDRQDIVEAEVVFPGEVPEQVRVFDPAGKETPSQILGRQEKNIRVLFLANVGSIGYAVYDVRPAPVPSNLSTGLKVTESSLENSRYIVQIDDNGDVSRIYDKQAGKEMLSAPMRLELLRDESRVWPAWEITYQTVSDKPAAYLSGPAKIRIMEKGPARVALEITRTAGNSRFVQTLRLSGGSAGDRLEFDTIIDWKTKGTLLKAAFPFSVSNPQATYDLGIGVIERGNNTLKLYEVPAQQWADITGVDGSYGVSVLNDCKYGWDKPDDRTIRLTLLHTPTPVNYKDQDLIDIGKHHLLYAVSGHSGGWRKGNTVWEAARLNQPLLAFQAPMHDGRLGRAFTFLKTNTPQVFVKAVKKAEDSDEIVVRLVETTGTATENVTVSFSAPVVSAREFNGAEEPLGPAEVKSGKLEFSMKPFQPRTFAVKISGPSSKLAPTAASPVILSFDLDVATRDRDKNEGDFDGKGNTFPGELLPESITCDGIPFFFGSTVETAPNAIACKGQALSLPEGNFNRLYLLAASAEGDTKGTFTVEGKPVELKVQEYTGFIGQWFNRMVSGKPTEDVDRIIPPYCKPDQVAWTGTHRHASTGKNEPYVFCYLFKYRIDLPKNCRAITLPDNKNIRILSATAALNENDTLHPSQTFYEMVRSLMPGLSENMR